MNACSRAGRRKGVVHASTASGLATSTSVTATTSGASPSSGSREGVTSSPSSTNSPICAIQAPPCMKPRTTPACGIRASPTMRPVRYAASSPEPPRTDHACVPGERDADDDHGRDPGRGERQPSQQPDRGDPDDDPAGDAEADLADEQQRAVREAVVIRGLPLDEPDHEDRRERVVDPALELEHRLDATAQTDAPHGGEDRRGVGRRDDGSDQERGAPVHVEGHVGGHRRNAGRDRHAERREQHRGASDPPHRLYVG